MKQLGIALSTQSTIVKNHHVIEETANQCEHSRYKKKVQVGQDIRLFSTGNTLLMLCKNFHSV
jgi:hypothetical protein